MKWIYLKQKDDKGFYDYYEIRNSSIIVKLDVENKTLSCLSQLLIKNGYELITEIEYDNVYKLCGF